ncbi:excitatory amino acid transporter-like isoform X2 [Macrobrachium nipponense]|uniref:excitatory amino acid transporter-like isoform X2 n=1 Tax=Macrobrachium nipponense TaxID=159736 RepID=UPI0030C8C7BC
MASSGDSVKAYAELSLALSNQEPIQIHSSTNNNNNSDDESHEKKKKKEKVSPPSSENCLLHAQYNNSAYCSPSVCRSTRQRAPTASQGVPGDPSPSSSQEFEESASRGFAERHWKNFKKSLPSGRKMSPVRVTDMRWGWVRKNLLLLITFSGVIVGVGLGLALRAAGPDSTTILLISYPGELFIRMLKLMILPLIIASLISGSASLNAKMNGRIVVRTVLYFIATSLLNAILGVILVVAIHPGSPLFKEALAKEISTAGSTSSNVNILDGFLDLGRNIFPDNLFQASFQQVHTVYDERIVTVRSNLTDGVEEEIPELVRKVKYRAGTNTLGIIVFCLVFGTLLGSLGKKGAIVIDFFSVIDAVILKIVTGIMWLSPLGVASVIMSKILSVENLGTVMSNLGLFIVTVVVGVLIWQWVFQNLIYFLFTHRNPFHFYINLLEPWVTSFATASTAATLPITFRCMNDKCGVDPRISRFVLPIGATVNMDGTALFVSVGTVFIAQMNEIPLGIGEYATIVVTATAASVASASVPSAALVLILIVLTSVNLPAEDVSLLFTIDWLVDRFRTTNNMLGDCYTAAIVEYWSQGELQAMDAETASTENPYPSDVEKAADLTPLESPATEKKMLNSGEIHVEVESTPKESATTTKM